MGLYIGNTRYCPVIGKAETLPYDAEIEYIETDGNAYINTGIKVTNNTRFVFDMYLPYMEASTYGCWLFGVRNSANVAQMALMYSRSSNTRRWSWRYGTAEGTLAKEPPVGSCIIENYTTSSQRIIRINDSTITATSQTFTGTSDMYIFTLNLGSAPATNNTLVGQRLLSVKLYQGSTLAFYAVPVRVGQVGYLYDKVSGNLLGNAGSGSFTLGPDVTT